MNSSNWQESHLEVENLSLEKIWKLYLLLADR